MFLDSSYPKPGVLKKKMTNTKNELEKAQRLFNELQKQKAKLELEKAAVVEDADSISVCVTNEVFRKITCFF